MKERLQGVLIGLTVGTLIAGGTVYAKSGTENIDVTYDNIKLFMDGEEITPKDGNGQIVEPFIYNGTTYLPIRAVGSAIGKEVSWDGVEKVIYLGTKPGTTESWMDECGPYLYTRGSAYKLEDNKFFVMSGKKYTNGFVLNPGPNEPYRAEALFNLDSKYKSVSFKVGHVDDSPEINVTMNVYLDGVIAYTKDLKYDDVAQNVTIPLNNALQMKIELTFYGTNNTLYGFSEGEFK
jgi:hypothetical protein